MVLRNRRNVKCTMRRLLLLCMYSLQDGKMQPGKNMIDQGPIFSRPTAVLQSAKCREIWMNNRLPPRQTDKKSSEGEGKGLPLPYVHKCQFVQVFEAVFED